VGAQELANGMTGTTSKILNGGKALEDVSNTLVGVSVVLNVADALSNGKWQNHNTADVVMTSIIYATSAVCPAAGLILGLTWFVGNLIYERYHDGRSMAEELDNR